MKQITWVVRKVGSAMIEFEEELKKFHPSLEVEDAEEAIYNQDLTDLADVLVKMVKDVKEEQGNCEKWYVINVVVVCRKRIFVPVAGLM